MRKRKEKGFRKELILPVFIVFIMVMSMFGYMWGSSNTKLEYNGYKIYHLETGGYMLKVNDQRILFNYFPEDIEAVPAPGNIESLFNSPMVYTTSDYDSLYNESIEQVKFGIAQHLSDFKNVYAQNAFTSETQYSLPVITCENATEQTPVLYFTKADKTEISFEDNCLTAKARTREELFMVYERIIYSIFGVME